MHLDEFVSTRVKLDGSMLQKSTLSKCKGVAKLTSTSTIKKSLAETHANKAKRDTDKQS